MLRNFSIEVNPGEPKMIDAAPQRLDPGTEVFMTWIPGKNPMDTIGPAKKLRDAGLYPDAPYRRATRAKARRSWRISPGAWLREAGVDRVLVIAGDRDTPAGPFDSSIAVMQSGILQKAGIKRILRRRVSGGQSENLRSAAVGSYRGENEVRAREWPGPYHRHAVRVRSPNRSSIGCAKSARGDRQSHPAGIRRARQPDLADALRDGLRSGRFHEGAHRKAAVRQVADRQGARAADPRSGAITADPCTGSELPLGIKGVHFFVFGGFNKTIDWINAQRAQQASA